MFGMAVADGYLDYNPFHDVKIPKVPGRRAIKIATPEQYARVRGCLPTKHLADLTGRSASPQHVAGGGVAQPVRAHRAKPGTAGGTSDDGPHRATAQALAWGGRTRTDTSRTVAVRGRPRHRQAAIASPASTGNGSWPPGDPRREP